MYLLPVAGLGVGFVYHRWGGRSRAGTVAARGERRRRAAAKIALAAVAFGLVSTAFSGITHAVAWASARVVPWVPGRLALGGVATVVLMLLVGREYLGPSLPLIDETLAGIDPGPWAFAWKLVFTAIAIGCGFPGGEVTPLFVIGTTLGGALAGLLGIPIPVLASVGLVAVFTGHANTPLACTVMGVELFGAGAVVPVAVGCVIAFVTSSHRGILLVPAHRRRQGPPRRRRVADGQRVACRQPRGTRPRTAVDGANG